MTRKQRPANDRDSGELKAWELPATDCDEAASCPLLETTTLLPLRYGRVETAPAGSEPGLPHDLKSRPLGYRLPRDGYIYILDENEHALHEYIHQDGELSGHNGGKLEYPKSHTLYVCFSEVPLTERKRNQVLASEEDRTHFMQKVSLSSASPVSGGKHLLTPEQAKLWVAEFSEDYQPEAPDEGFPQESEPYFWENQPYYHKTRFGKLIRQQQIEDPSDCLCLVLQDDVGVMLDLAQHQDDVVGWLDQWAASGKESGDTERDYVLGTVIESMTVVDKSAVLGSLKRLPDERSKAMLKDLEAQEEEEKTETLQALTNWLNTDSADGRGEGLSSRNHPAELDAKLQSIREEATRTNYYEITDRLNWTTEDFYTRRALADLDDGFVNKHIETVKALKKQHNESLRGVLEGGGFGKQGINELIDRPRMESFMAAQRPKLARWQSELALITEDRANLLCDSRYHHAAWYFDFMDEEQVAASLTLESMCIKDVCRTDEATEQVAKWMQDHPQYTRPMFHTLPLPDQSVNKEPMTTYASILKAGYSVVTNSKEFSDNLFNAEAGRLPALEKMSEDIRLQAAAIGDALSPAVSMSMAKTMDQLYQGLESDRLPPLDEIFRDLPFFLKGKLLEAAHSGKVEFKVASVDELGALKQNLHKIMQLNNQLSDISDQHDRAKATQGHRSPQARQLVEQFHAVREEQRVLGERLALALSPIDETDGKVSLAPPDELGGKAALSVALPAIEQREVARMMQSIRKGSMAVPDINALGDGIGVAIFFVQLGNLVSVWKEFLDSKNAFGSGRKSALPVWEAIFGASSAGFACAQGVVDSALGARAKQLAVLWQRSELRGVHVQIGKLHSFLGALAYLAGFIGASFSFNKHRNNWLEAVKSGNHQAEIAAVMAMVGSGGLVATNSVGFVSSMRTMAQVAAASRQAAMKIGGDAVQTRAAVWAASGPRLATLFARLNLAGLVFTVVELSATWYYNYNNRSKRDDWLSSTPWSSDQSRNQKLTLEKYIEVLEQTGSAITLSQNGVAEGEPQGFYLNCYGLPATALNRPISQLPKHKVSLACWRVQPESGWTPWTKDPEIWVRSMAPVLESLHVSQQADYLQIGFSSPPHEKTAHGIVTSELALMVKIEILQPDEHYLGEVYMLRVRPDSGFPLVPVQETPKESPIWRELDWPNVATEPTE